MQINLPNPSLLIYSSAWWSCHLQKTGGQFSRVTQLLGNLAYLSHGINAAMEAIDEQQYQALLQLQCLVHAKHSFANTLSKLDPLVMEGRAIIFNRQMPLHPDRLDPFTSWAIMIVLGDSQNGGDL